MKYSRKLGGAELTSCLSGLVRGRVGLERLRQVRPRGDGDEVPPHDDERMRELSPAQATRAWTYGELSYWGAEVLWKTLALDPALPPPLAIRKANEMMGTSHDGPLPEQATRLLQALGI